MPDYVTLTCPSCGAKLQITEDMDRFACGYCGQEHIVKRGGGVVSLAPVVEGLRQVQRGTDLTAAELAIARLEKELGPAEAAVHEFAATQKYSSLGPPDSMIALLVFGMAFFGLAALCSATGGGDTSATAITSLLFVVCVVEWARRDMRRTKAGKIVYEQRLRELRARAEEIRRELERNRQIVRGK